MLSFVETMRGAVTEPGGTERTVEFTVSATRVGTGRFELKGLARAAPWLAEGEVRGTLVMSLLPPAITYHLELPGGVSLDAQKDPRPWRPLHSFTFMPVTLTGADGRVLAQGSMRFDLRELPKFAASWLPWASQRRQLDAQRRQLLRAELDRG